MIYTHEQMKKRFGSIFVINVLNNGAIEEHYDTDYFPYERYDTVEAAKLEAIKQKEKLLKKEEERISNLLRDYQTLPFLSKIRTFLFRSGYKASKVAKEVLNDKRAKTLKCIQDIQNTPAIMLNVDKTYDIEFPDIKLNDKIFLVVENDNLLEAGFYEGKVVELKYAIYNDNQVRLIGDFIVVSQEEEKYMSLKVDNDGKLYDGYSGHTIFLDEEKAKTFSNKIMKKKADFYTSKIKK